MSRSPSTRRRLRPVRLCDVPLAERRRAAVPLLREAAENANLVLAVELKRAVELPSERVYWISA